jgi:hypothetical protein
MKQQKWPKNMRATKRKDGKWPLKLNYDPENPAIIYVTVPKVSKTNSVYSFYLWYSNFYE